MTNETTISEAAQEEGKLLVDNIEHYKKMLKLEIEESKDGQNATTERESTNTPPVGEG